MERALLSFYPLMILMPLLMSALSYVKSLFYKKAEFRHLCEFYLSMSLVTASSWLLLPLGSAFVILSMLPWIWTLRTFGLICQDISRLTLFNKFHYYALGLGGVISIIFLSFDFALSLITVPFSLSVGLIGFTFIFQAYSRGKTKSYSYLHHFNLFLILSYFVTRLFFPVLIANSLRLPLVSIIDSYLLMALCASLYPMYAEIVFEGQERLLEKVLHARNRQLLSHSGFSEYKILSAGLSHELNNALTIINAKIVRLIKGRTEELEKDLLIIQKASNRIGNSIRGLREFIYPHEVQEVLDCEDVMNEVLALYSQRLINHGVQIKLNNLNGKLVKGQRVQLEQVFLSLINNSVEAVDELDEKWISLTGRIVRGNVVIHYQDASRSKADQIIPLLSDPFYSFHEFMENDIRLILAKEITERYGGSLICDHKNEFSTFIITLPQADAINSTEMKLQHKIQEVRELH